MNEHLSLAELETFDSRAPHRAGTRRFLCPSCGADKRRDAAHRSLAVNTHTGAWTCHRCAAKGLLKEFWTKRENTSHTSFVNSRRARTRAALAQALALPEAKASQAVKAETEDEKTARAWAAWRDALRLLNNRENSGQAYLEGRGIDATLAANAGVRFAPNFYGHAAVLFPVTNRAGEVVAVSSRFINPRGDFKTISIGNKSSGVFVTPNALASPVIAVTEAPIDALALWMCGIPAIALIGCTAPEWLLAALAGRDVLLATDADDAGDKVAEALTPRIVARGGRVLRLRARGAKDWGEALERIGETPLRRNLAAFAPVAHDAIRAMRAFELHDAGRTDAARFLTGLIKKGALRESVRARLQQPDAHLAGESLDEIHIPAEIAALDEATIERCCDAQRLSVSGGAC